VKQQYYVAISMFVTKLEGHFVNFKLMNPLGIVYPQFWMQFYVDLPFSLHVATLLWPSVGVKPNTWKK
jgi:hypothetical protein